MYKLLRGPSVPFIPNGVYSYGSHICRHLFRDVIGDEGPNGVRSVYLRVYVFHIFRKLGRDSLKGQSPTSYHFSPLFPQNVAGTYNNAKNRSKWEFYTKN